MYKTEETGVLMDYDEFLEHLKRDKRNLEARMFLHVNKAEEVLRSFKNHVTKPDSYDDAQFTYEGYGVLQGHANHIADYCSTLNQCIRVIKWLTLYKEQRNSLQGELENGNDNDIASITEENN